MQSQTELKQASYEAGRRLGKIHMGGGLGITQVVEKGGGSLLKQAAGKAACVGLGAEALVARITAFHDERVAALPDLNVYPELKGERDILLEKYRGMADEGMSRELIALCESLGFWCNYRCHAETGKRPRGGPLPPEKRGPPPPEKRERCRVVYAPETDRGALHFKNVDDPLHSWRPLPVETPPTPWPFSPLFYDGVGNGLHIDDVPPEIFPADAREVCARHCTTVPEAEAMLIRYNYFWGSANLLIHDEAGHAVAIDKASRCRYAVRRQGPNGVIYINGMSSFDPAYQAFIEARRRQYLAESGQDDNTPEACYFRFAQGTLRNMQRRMKLFEANPTAEALVDHLSSRDADGPLCRPGLTCHPDDPVREATLVQRFHLLDERVLKWRQWVGEIPVWEDEWKTLRYS